MLRATKVIPAAERSNESPMDSVTLDFEDRHRRRLRLTGDNGGDFLLDLAEARVLRDGDGLVLEDGVVIAVRSAPERLAEISCETPLHLTRIAWHLGNRHCPTQILGDKLRIRFDHVLVEMVRQLGAQVTELAAPFEPEGGAYRHDHD